VIIVLSPRWLLPYGIALGAFGALIYLQWPHPILPALLFGGLAFAPREQRGVNVTAVVVLVSSVLLRWLALDSLLPSQVLAVCIASQVVSRSAMLTIAWVSTPSGNGAAEKVGANLTIPVAIAVMILGFAAAFYCGLRPGMGILVGAYLIVRAVRWISYRYAGGVTGDSLGLTQLLTELFVLLMFTCSACRW
jgi:adenosylcobinamide-GDP ribazoletransferase